MVTDTLGRKTIGASTQSIAIIGGGPMGLSCAYELLKRGHQVTVYEAGPVLGGMSVTFDLDGIDLERF